MIALLLLAVSARAAVQTHGDVGQNGFDKRLSSFGVDVYRRPSGNLARWVCSAMYFKRPAPAV